MVRSGQQPDQMRDDQSDEADDPADGDGGSRQEGGEQKDGVTRALHGNAGCLRMLVSQQQQIQRAAEQRDKDDRCRNRERDQLHMLPSSRLQPALKPEDDAAQLLLMGRARNHDIDDRGQERVDADAKQQQLRHIRLATGLPDGEDKDDGSQGAGEGRQRQRVGSLLREAGSNHEDGPGRRSRGDAEIAGLNQRITEHALHGGARHGESGSDQDANQDAGEADRRDNRQIALGNAGMIQPSEGVQDGLQRIREPDGDGADGAAGDDR